MPRSNWRGISNIRNPIQYEMINANFRRFEPFQLLDHKFLLPTAMTLSLGLAASLLKVATAPVVGRIFENNTGSIPRLSILLTALVVAAIILDAANQFSSQKIVRSQLQALQIRLAKKLLEYNYDFRKSKPPQDNSQIALVDAPNAISGIIASLNTLVSIVFLAIPACLLIGKLSRSALISTLALLLVALFIAEIGAPKVRRHSGKVLAAQRKTQMLHSEFFNDLRDIKNQLDAALPNELVKTIKDTKDTVIELMRTRLKYGIPAELFLQVAPVVATVIVVMGNKNSPSLTSEAATTFILSSQLSNPIQGLSHLIFSWQQTSKASSNVLELLNTYTSKSTASIPPIESNEGHHLEIFRRGDSNELVIDPNHWFVRVPSVKFDKLIIRIGDPLLICGSSGIGKTSLLWSICGWLEKSVILNNDFSISSQSPRFIDTSQIKGFIPSNSQDRLSKLFKDLNIEEICKGLDPKLGLSAACDASLSGGEKLRLAFFRLASSPKTILLADEPTASLNDDFACTIAEHIEHDRSHAWVVVTHDHRLIDRNWRKTEIHLTCSIQGAEHV